MINYCPNRHLRVMMSDHPQHYKMVTQTILIKLSTNSFTPITKRSTVNTLQSCCVSVSCLSS
jgi:hypothetical protein